MNWWPWSRPHSSDEPIHPHCLMPTVPEALQTSLKSRPVMLLGERWTAPKPRMILEEDSWVRPVEQLEDFHGPIG